METTNQKKFTPLLFVELYLSFTILLFLIGPWDFRITNPGKLYGGVVIFQLLLALGYYVGIKYIKIEKNTLFRNDSRNLKFVKILMPIYFIVLLIGIPRSLGLSSISIKLIFEKLMFALENPALSYYSKMDITQANVFLGKLGTIIMFLGSPISYVLLALMMLYFDKMSRFYKAFSLVLISMYVINYVATGTNKGVFDIIIILISVIFIKSFTKKTTKKKRSTKIYIRIFVLIFVGLLSFNYMIGSRSIGTNLGNNSRIGEQIPLKQDSVLLKVLPQPLEKPTVLLSTYLTQGYYGLALSMEVPSTPMLGAGGSMFIVDQVTKSGYDINQYTLQQKVQDKFGWHSRVQWFTFYSWIANDFGFIGVGIYMFLLGLIFALVYKDILLHNNIIAKVIFALLMIQFFFVPANNQLMVNMNSFFSTIFIFIMWYLSKTKILLKK